VWRVALLAWLVGGWLAHALIVDAAEPPDTWESYMATGMSRVPFYPNLIGHFRSVPWSLGEDVVVVDPCPEERSSLSPMESHHVRDTYVEYIATHLGQAANRNPMGGLVPIWKIEVVRDLIIPEYQVLQAPGVERRRCPGVAPRNPEPPNIDLSCSRVLKPGRLGAQQGYSRSLGHVERFPSQADLVNGSVGGALGFFKGASDEYDANDAYADGSKSQNGHGPLGVRIARRHFGEPVPLGWAALFLILFCGGGVAAFYFAIERLTRPHLKDGNND
jgi:hypothetical protein